MAIQAQLNLSHSNDVAVETQKAFIKLHLQLQIKLVSILSFIICFHFENVFFCLVLGRYLYTVYIISDSYIGFDQQYDVQIEVIPGQQKKNDKIIDYDFPKLI